jgi:GNAT superfamily N-acetyltransferase
MCIPASGRRWVRDRDGDHTRRGLSRAATVDDLDAVMSIVARMFEDLGTATTEEWRDDARQMLAERLWTDVAVFVVDHDAEVAACAIGVLHDSLPSPRRVGTKVGYVEWVAKLTRYRRYGYARAANDALVGWLIEHGAAVIDLHSSAMAVPLYGQLGFQPPRATALRIQTKYSVAT